MGPGTWGWPVGHAQPTLPPYDDEHVYWSLTSQWAAHAVGGLRFDRAGRIIVEQADRWCWADRAVERTNPMLMEYFHPGLQDYLGLCRTHYREIFGEAS